MWDRGAAEREAVAAAKRAEEEAAAAAKKQQEEEDAMMEALLANAFLSLARTNMNAVDRRPDALAL